jgi:hypothetical protein
MKLSDNHKRKHAINLFLFDDGSQEFGHVVTIKKLMPCLQGKHGNMHTLADRCMGCLQPTHEDKPCWANGLDCGDVRLPAPGKTFAVTKAMIGSTVHRAIHGVLAIDYDADITTLTTSIAGFSAEFNVQAEDYVMLTDRQRKTIVGLERRDATGTTEDLADYLDEKVWRKMLAGEHSVMQTHSKPPKDDDRPPRRDNCARCSDTLVYDGDNRNACCDHVHISGRVLDWVCTACNNVPSRKEDKLIIVVDNLRLLAGLLSNHYYAQGRLANIRPAIVGGLQNPCELRLGQLHLVSYERLFGDQAFQALEGLSSSEAIDAMQANIDVVRQATRQAGIADPLNNMTVGQTSLSSAFVMCPDASFELISDPDMYQFAQQGVCGALVDVGLQVAHASESKHILKTDMVGAYGGVLGKQLPVGDFKWVTSYHELEQLRQQLLKQNTGIGAYVEASITPRGAWRRDLGVIRRGDDDKWTEEITSCTCVYSHAYVVSCIRSGDDVHFIKALSFRTDAVLKDYVDFLAQKRDTTADAERSYWKLLLNSLWGKLCQRQGRHHKESIIEIHDDNCALILRARRRNGTVDILSPGDIQAIAQLEPSDEELSHEVQELLELQDEGGEAAQYAITLLRLVNAGYEMPDETDAHPVQGAYEVTVADGFQCELSPEEANPRRARTRALGAWLKKHIKRLSFGRATPTSLLAKCASSDAEQALMTVQASGWCKVTPYIRRAVLLTRTPPTRAPEVKTPSYLAVHIVQSVISQMQDAHHAIWDRFHDPALPATKDFRAGEGARIVCKLTDCFVHYLRRSNPDVKAVMGQAITYGKALGEWKDEYPHEVIHSVAAPRKNLYTIISDSMCVQAGIPAAAEEQFTSDSHFTGQRQEATWVSVKPQFSSANSIVSSRREVARFVLSTRSRLPGSTHDTCFPSEL